MSVSKQMRYCGKNMFVFPSFYGSFYKQCAPNLWKAIKEHKLKLNGGIPLKKHLKKEGYSELGDCDFDNDDEQPGTFVDHIKQVEKSFWKDRFQVYADWKRKWFSDYEATGSISTLTGFQISGNYKRNDIINYPIQGSAFHCLLWSLIELNKQLKKRKMKSKIVGQIHDSIVADVHKKEVDEYLQLAKEIMTKRIRKAWKWIIVPLDVEAEVTPLGGNWFDKKEVPL